MVVMLILVGVGRMRLTTPLVDTFPVGPVGFGSFTLGPATLGPILVWHAFIGLFVLWLVLGINALFTFREQSKKKG
jgi:hypothetical protein